jgi:energy-coupling factor transporter ATP-binding protein EcfA2
MSLRLRELSLLALGVFDHATFRIPEADVESTKLILFEGPNGAGKTTVLEAIAHFLGMNGSTDPTPTRSTAGWSAIRRAEKCGPRSSWIRQPTRAYALPSKFSRSTGPGCAARVAMRCGFSRAG